MTFACIALLASACLPRTTPAPELPADVTSVYTCAGDYRFSVRESGEVATVRLPDRTIALPRAGAESGRRYVRGDTTFWHRGETATLTVSGEDRADCRGRIVASPWDEARLLGVDYRAVGYEPGWSLEMDAGSHIRFVMDGGSALYLPIPEPTTAAGKTAYRTASGGVDLELIIEESPCIDRGGRASLPNTVELLLGGISYRGCGQPLSTDSPT